MKINKNSIVFILFLTFFSFVLQSTSAQYKIIQPTEFFQNFPEIKWGINVETAKKLIEKKGWRAIRPIKTEMAWLTKFDDVECRGALRFTNGKLYDVVVQTYDTEKGKELYEKWLKRLTVKQGKAHEFLITEDITSNVWRFKDVYVVELRLLKFEGENRYTTDIHWVKQ